MEGQASRSSASDLSHKEDHQSREAREDGAAERDDAGDHHLHQIIEPIVDPGELMIDAVETPIDLAKAPIYLVKAPIDFRKPSINLERPVVGPLFRPVEAFFGLLFGTIETLFSLLFGSVEAFVHPLREFIESTVGPLCHPPLPLCRDRHEEQAKAEIYLSETRKVPSV